MKRKHKYRLKHKLLALLMVLSGIQAFAQSSGTSCGTAIPLNISSNNSTTVTEIWYSFTTIGTGQGVEVVHSTNSNHSHFHKAALISGTCGSTTVLDSVEIGSGDSVLYIQSLSLSANTQYFVRLSRDTSSTCGRCTNDTIQYSVILTDPTLPYSCTPDPFVCNYISNPGFESGPHPTMVRGFANHYVDCWDGKRINPGYFCNTPQTYNTADVFDITAPQVWGNCQQAFVGIPTNWKDNGVVMPRTQNNTRFAHILYTESIDGALTATLTPDKYYFELWYSLPTCGWGGFDGNLCITLFNSANPTQASHIGNFSFNTMWTAQNDGTWNAAGICADLTNVSPSDLATYDRIFIYGGNNAGSWFLDDLSLTKMADAGPDQTVCIGNSTVIGPQCPLSSPTYSWSPSVGLSCTNCANPSANPTSTTTYTVTVTDSAGTCSATDVVTVNVISQPTTAISGNIYKCPINNSSTFTYQVNSQAHCTYSWTVSNVSAPLVVQGTNWITVDWSTTMTQPSTITVIVNDTLHGCSVKDTLHITECCISPNPQDTTMLNPVSSIVFPTGTTSGIAYINGTLTINQNLTATNVHWYFGTDAKVKILPGVSVRIQESVLEAGCGIMWDGILIMDSTAYLDIDASVVEDAYEAVRSEHGGHYYIHARTKLNKNRYGVVVTAYNNNHPGVIEETEITCLPSLYSTGNYLLPPLSNMRTDAGVHITDVKNITVGSTASPAYINKFENMNVGVRSIRSNTNAYNNEFKNINTLNQYNVAQAGYWATGKPFSFPPISFVSYTHTIGSTAANSKNYFVNCINGVRGEINLNMEVNSNDFTTIQFNGVIAQNCKLFNSISIKNNNIYNAHTGVRLMNNTNVTATVDNNLIEYNATPPQWSFGTYGTGVQLNETNNMTVAAYTVSNNTLNKLRMGVSGMNLHKPKIFQNTISVTPGTWWLNAVRGISIVRSFNPRITNNIVNTTTATTAPQKGGIYVSSSQQSLVSCNDIEDIGYDIQCSGTPMTSSTISLNDLYDSRWGLMVSNSAIIGQQGTYTSPSCNTWNGTFTAGLFSTSSAIGPVIYYKPSGTYIPPSNVATNAGILWSPSASSASSVCKGCYWYNPISARELEGQIAGDYDLTEAGQWMIEHAVYQMMRDDSSTLADSSEVLAGFADTLDLENIGVYEQAMRTLNDPYTSSQEKEYAMQATEGTTPVNELEEYFKTVIAIFGEMVVSESDPDESQLIELQSIAAMCPFTEGPAVYIARSLLAPYDSTFYINDCELSPDDSIGARIAQQPVTEGNAQTQVYPNPADEELTVIVSLKDGEAGRFEIYDARGSRVVSQVLKAGQEPVQVKVGQLTPGVYFYRIFVNDHVIDGNKLVIMK